MWKYIRIYPSTIQREFMKNRHYPFLVILLAALMLGGCSFSTSSKHSSKSSSSPSRASSARSPEAVTVTSQSFQEDVSSLAILYVGSSGSSTDFRRELGQIAKTHGIADWKNTASTYDAIGHGLKQANIAKQDLESLPFLEGLDFSPYYSRIISSLE